ncbi:hypothetical protein B0T09DRAFT_120478 [Sordaria sp. MPI-SDFR-AT-0083]|nr:hypothetical protein B0T09DRAFT_120478 [Sordaria sp. MPI-SDFR-AT-0083]
MSFGPDYHLSGGYFDTGNNPPQTLSAGIFRPPASPADSNHNLAKSTGSLFSDISMSNGTSPLQTPEQANAKRKRLGLGVRGGTLNDHNMQVDGMNDGKAETGMADAGQTRYNLAGQLNATPTGGAVTANGRLEESMYSDLDYRRAAGSKRAHDDPDGPSPQGEGQVDPSTQQHHSANSSKWGFLGLQTLGSVVGKVWEFCKGGAFRGFQAGGGTGYEVNGSTVTPSVQATAVGQPWASEQREQPIHFTMEADQDTSMPPQETVMTPISHPVQEFVAPQQDFSSPPPLPMSDYMPYAPEYHETSNPYSLIRPAVKRRQVSENQDDLNRNWVMVDENGNGGSPSPMPAVPSFSAAAMPSFGGASSGRATPGLRPPSLRTRTPGLPSSNATRRITAPSQRFTGGPSMLPRTRAPSRLSQHTVAPDVGAQELPSFGAPTPRSPVSNIPTPSFSTPTTTAAPVSRIPLPASAGGGPGSGGARPSFGSLNAAASNGRQSPGLQSPSYANPTPFAFSSPAYQSSSASRPASRQSVRPASRQSVRPASRQSLGGGGGGSSNSTRRSLQAPIQLSSPAIPRPSTSSSAKVLKSPTNHNHHHRRGESSGAAAGGSSHGSSTGRPPSSMRRSRGVSLHSAFVEDGLKASPRLDGEAKHLAKKKIAAERDADANIDAFNEKLLQMIRQGKEALGTKVEVLDDRGNSNGVWEEDEL